MLEQAKIILQKTGGDKLPSLPHVLLKCLDIIHADRQPFDGLAEIIRLDPALYVKTMLVGNPSEFNKNSSKPLEQLLAGLGMDTIKSIVITSAVQQFFSRYSHERVEFLKQHWSHSVLCAQLAESIAKHTGYKQTDDAYISGLIHDVGQLAMENVYPKRYTSTFAQLSEDDYFHDLENEEFDTTHYHVGSLLLREHGIDPFIADAVLYHHESSDLILDAHPLVKIIHLSNQLSNTYFKEEDHHIFEFAEKIFGLSRPLLLEILNGARDEVARISEELEMDLKHDGVDGATAKQIEGGDQLKQIQLAEQVRNIAMLDGAYQHLANSSDQADFIRATRLQAGILFGVSNVIVFRYEKKDNLLIAMSSEHQLTTMGDLRIPLEPDRSLVSEAVLTKAVVHSFDKDNVKKAVIDQQLAGLGDSEGLFCAPMFSDDRVIGVLVFGICQEQQKQLWKQRSMIMRFARDVAHTLNSLVRSNTTPTADSIDQMSRLEKSNREIAHEIRNPLSIINNYLEILGIKLDRDHPAHQDLGTIRSEIIRIGCILEKLSNAEASVESATPVDINATLTQLTQVFKNALNASKSIKIELDLDEGMPLVTCKPNMIKQIYTNLVKNAIEALPAKGQILVYTSSNVNVSGQEFVEISVDDNGPGIADDLLPDLFSPVHTKKGGNHSGLGLTIVKDLVYDLHGTISCKSNKKGTSFRILLPKI